MNTANPRAFAMPQPTSANSNAVCKLCTIRLELLCYQRARWFRAFRAVLAGAVRVWSLFHPVAPDLYLSRSKECHACIRFRKNVLKEESRIFRWLDGYINPLFNRARDSLLTPQEMNAAREHAKREGLTLGNRYSGCIRSRLDEHAFRLGTGWWRTWGGKRWRDPG